MVSFEKVNFSSCYSVNIPGRWRLFYLVFAAQFQEHFVKQKTKISGWDYFSKSRNCNLHLLVHKVFIKFRCEYEIKQTPSSRYIYSKTVAEVYPFERHHYSPSRPLATDGEQLVQGDSESANIVSRPKAILVAPV